MSFCHRISNMMIIDANNNSTSVVYKDKKNGIVIRCGWLLFNTELNKQYQVVAKIFNSKDENIYSSNSIANVDGTIHPVLNFDFNGRKTFSFTTTLRMDNSSEIYNILQCNEIYKLRLFIDEESNKSDAYFLLKAGDSYDDVNK